MAIGTITPARTLEWHQALVETPSLSHQEEPLAQWVTSQLEALGVKVERIGRNIVATTGVGPKLLFNSHLDTVPPCDGWTQDPWKVTRIGGKVIGLGSNDAKASVACMMAAFAAIHENGGPVELTLMLVADEETGGEGTEMAWPAMVKQGYDPQGIVVGEPTGLQLGVAQKGLMILELVASGTACHAAHAGKIGGRNAVYTLAEDLVTLEKLYLGPPDPELGPITVQPTMLQASAISNQVAGEVTCVVDIRTVPGIEHDGVIKWVTSQLQSKVKVRSSRLKPYRCPEDALIIAAAKRARAASAPFSSATMSDQVFFQGYPSIKCGPGETNRSHTADEYVMESELIEATEFYIRLAEEFAHVATVG